MLLHDDLVVAKFLEMLSSSNTNTLLEILAAKVLQNIQ